MATRAIPPFPRCLNNALRLGSRLLQPGKKVSRTNKLQSQYCLRLRLEEIFDLQDRVAVTIVGAIAPKLEQAEIERVRYKPTDSLDAYDFYMRGMASLYRWSGDSLSEALKLFYKAIELDPHFAPAYGMAAWCYIRRLAEGAVIDRAKEGPETERLGRQAARLGKDDALALCAGGFALVTTMLGSA